MAKRKEQTTNDLREILRHRYWAQHKIRLKTAAQIEKIRAACTLTAQILDATCQKAQAGITTLELNDFAHQLHLQAGALPAPLHYGNPPYPKSICTSLNEVICHGIPDRRPLQEGDILNIDVSSILHGYYGDCSQTIIIGKTDPERAKVVAVAYQCLMESAAILGPTVPIRAIGEAITHCATRHGCSVVHQFVGHGVGVEFHENPQIPHHRNNMNLPMVPGMIFTIEPMINLGVAEGVIDPHDGWTARTKDGKPSAQFEHTFLITEEGYEILTPWTCATPLPSLN